MISDSILLRGVSGSSVSNLSFCGNKALSRFAVERGECLVRDHKQPRGRENMWPTPLQILQQLNKGRYAQESDIHHKESCRKVIKKKTSLLDSAICKRFPVSYILGMAVRNVCPVRDILPGVSIRTIDPSTNCNPLKQGYDTRRDNSSSSSDYQVRWKENEKLNKKTKNYPLKI